MKSPRPLRSPVATCHAIADAALARVIGGAEQQKPERPIQYRTRDGYVIRWLD